MVATAEGKKVRYHNKDTKTFAWASPDDLPEYALLQEGVQKQLTASQTPLYPANVHDAEDFADDSPTTMDTRTKVIPATPSKPNDYSADIEQWRAELRTAVEDIRAARDPQQSFRARNRAEQYKLAIDIYTAAELIPATMTQFGSYRETFHFRVPPRLDEYADLSPLRHGIAHRYLTSDPVEIAYLRTLSDYTEVPVGTVYSRAVGGRDGIWVPFEVYEQQKKIGQAA
jgi:hypothetical protein